MTTEVIARLVRRGKREDVEVLVPNAWAALSERATTMQQAYRERIATGNYDQAKERRDLKAAFFEACAEARVAPKDRERLWRRWF